MFSVIFVAQSLTEVLPILGLLTGITSMALMYFGTHCEVLYINASPVHFAWLTETVPFVLSSRSVAEHYTEHQVEEAPE